ncbi:DNA polymerase III subunit psi [Thalassotalea marina]|uniref:DNA polymerase III subunit psi n=1 Tax=Thalassotalea marina TaxID=1673741 RepID=A0A919BNX5_9GAMM|nr:DNA polymerase III subunit psi [Thalassotalea marina]GHG03462.1 hypothetical protein GCM10017161_35960 [Thalassotalea marina]
MIQSQKHFNYLQEMGVSLWRRRVLDTSIDTIKANNQQASSLQINVADLLTQTLFTDILLVLSIEPSTVKQIDQATINLGDFQWQFCEQNTFSFSQQQLTTPVLNELTTPANKRALYQLFITNQLV